MNVQLDYSLNFPPLISSKADANDINARLNALHKAIHSEDVMQRQKKSMKREYYDLKQQLIAMGNLQHSAAVVAQDPVRHQNSVAIVPQPIAQLEESDSEEAEDVDSGEEQIIIQPDNNNSNLWNNPFPIGPKKFTTTQLLVGTASLIGIVAAGLYAWSNRPKREPIKIPHASLSTTAAPISTTAAPISNQVSSTSRKYTWEANNQRSLYKAVKNYCRDIYESWKSSEEGKKGVRLHKERLLMRSNYIKKELKDRTLEYLLEKGKISRDDYILIMGKKDLKKFRTRNRIYINQTALLKQKNIIQ